LRRNYRKGVLPFAAESCKDYTSHQVMQQTAEQFWLTKEKVNVHHVWLNTGFKLVEKK
jgi:hypothetical protein